MKKTTTIMYIWRRYGSGAVAEFWHALSVLVGGLTNVKNSTKPSLIKPHKVCTYIYIYIKRE